MAQSKNTKPKTQEEAAPNGAAVLAEYKKDIQLGLLRGAILLCGREAYLVKKALEAAEEAFINPAVRELDFTQMDGAGLDIQALIAQCETLPTFSEKRIVWVRDFRVLEGKKQKDFTEEKEKALLEEIKNIPPETLLIFTAGQVDKRLSLVKALKAGGGLFEMGPVDPSTLEKYAAKVLKPFGKTISSSAFRLLIDMEGYYPSPNKYAEREEEYTLYNLENDLKKLACAAEGPEISRKEVEELSGNNLEMNTFRIMDAAANGKKGEALIQLKALLKANQSVYSLLALLVNQLEIMLCIKEMQDQGVPFQMITTTIGGSPYRIKNVAQLGRLYETDRVREIFRFALNIDSSIKRGEMDGEVALELLVAKM